MTALEEVRFGSSYDEQHLLTTVFSPSGRPYLEQILRDVNPDDFEDPTAGWIWAAARYLRERNESPTKRSILALRDSIAPPKVSGETEAEKFAKLSTGHTSSLPWCAPHRAILAERLGEVVGQPIYPTSLPQSVRVVVESGKLRRLFAAVERSRALVAAAGDYSTALESVHRLVADLEGSTAPPEVMGFDELMDEFEEDQRSSPESRLVIPSPWPPINDLLSGGWSTGRLYLVAGRPGAGKTNLGIGAAVKAARTGHPTLIVSQEMSRIEVAGRIVAGGAYVEYHQITGRCMDYDDQQAVKDFRADTQGLPLWVIDRPGLTIEFIAALCRTMKRTHGLQLVTIDYLQLLAATDSRVIREQQVSHISRQSKLLARELEIPVLMLTQLNRGNVKDGRRPELWDLRESGTLEQDCDAAILLHHEKTREGGPNGIVYAILAKSRFGRTETVELRWHGHQARVGD